LTDELKCTIRVSGEVVFQGARCWSAIFLTVRETSGGYSWGLSAAESNPAAGVVAVEIHVDVRELTPELEGVLAPQVRDVILKIGSRVLEIYGPATPAA
jgi:hypothetical protein